MNMLSSDEKLLCQVSFPWEAEQLAQELKKHEISCRIVKGSREYTAIVLGGTGNPTLVYVSDTDFDKATEKMNVYFASLNGPEAQKMIQKKHFIRKIVVYTLLSFIFIPLFFNLLATYNYWLMLKQEPNHKHKLIVGLIVLGGWIMVVFWVRYLLR